MEKFSFVICYRHDHSNELWPFNMYGHVIHYGDGEHAKKVLAKAKSMSWSAKEKPLKLEVYKLV